MTDPADELVRLSEELGLYDNSKVPITECECGALIKPPRTKCKECRLIEDAKSSQCPFCMTWYYTHRGESRDKEEMLRHSMRRCL